ncbi:MAG: hypothetical protein SGPRY_000311, partial [Prymnesium sp.]
MAVQSKPRHVVHGLVTGGAGLRRGVMEGLTGLISAPIEGAQSQGVAGLIKGIGKGVVGAVVKPTAGMFDLATCTAEGIANTFDFIEESRGDRSELERMRPPRMMYGAERAVRPFSRSEALAQRVLLELRGGAYAYEPLQMCVQLRPGELLVLTSGRLLLASTTTHRSTCHYPLVAIDRVKLDEERKSVKVGTNHAITSSGPRKGSIWGHLFKLSSYKRHAELSNPDSSETSPTEGSPLPLLNPLSPTTRSSPGALSSKSTASALPWMSGKRSLCKPALGGNARPTNVRPREHEIECHDMNTPPPQPAWLLASRMTQSRSANPKRIACFRELDQRQQIPRPLRPLLPTTSTLSHPSNITLIERAALLVSYEREEAEHDSVSTEQKEDVPELTHAGSASQSSVLSSSLQAGDSWSPRRAHLEASDGLSQGRQGDSKKSFEKSQQISHRLKHDMEPMPDVSDKLRPEVDLKPQTQRVRNSISIDVFCARYCPDATKKVPPRFAANKDAFAQKRPSYEELEAIGAMMTSKSARESEYTFCYFLAAR